MYFLDVVQGVRPTGFLKNYPSVPNDLSLGGWCRSGSVKLSIWLVYFDTYSHLVTCASQFLLLCANSIDERPIFNAQNFERTLVALESSPIPFLPWTLSMNLGGPFPRKLGIIRLHSGQCPTKKSDLFFGLVPCMFFTDMLQFLWWLDGSLPSSPKASCSEICSWNDKLMIWFHVCVHISPKKSVSQRVPLILSHHQLAVANAKAALERPGAISSRPLAWRPTVMRKLEEMRLSHLFWHFLGSLYWIWPSWITVLLDFNWIYVTPKNAWIMKHGLASYLGGLSKEDHVIISLGPVLRIVEIRIRKDWRKNRWCFYILCFKKGSSGGGRKSGQG